MRIHSFCCECGINVKVDEDGCCATCGVTATGSALSEISPRVELAEVAELRKRIRRIARTIKPIADEDEESCVNVAYQLCDLRKPARGGR